MFPKVSAVSPLLASVTVWAALGDPTFRPEKARLAGVKATTAPGAVPLRWMTCGEPAASSWITIDPYRGPAAVGANVTENVQLPAAGTMLPQSLVAAKSPLTVTDEIDSGVLPMFRKSVLVAGLLDPTGWLAYCR